MIHLRTHTDEKGDTVDLSWYCCELCYSRSFKDNPEAETFEKGGAYPGGSEHDLPDFCADCGDPVGNPLTPEGMAYVREFVADRYDLPYKEAGCDLATAIALQNEYSYLW
jgi:hypothetical protein